MISVPNAVKNLYHNDHAYKNIRIHFPNGERSDICNDLIVKDSVSFKESLCSQNKLKFGLCESPVFECEVVGVGNIKGATINVSVEVECPSTVLGAEWCVDLQKYVYSIPYGTFIVNECERQSDMIHRKISAFSEVAIRDWNISYFEQYKMNWNPVYEPKTVFWLASNGISAVEDVCDSNIQPWSTKSYSEDNDPYVMPGVFSGWQAGYTPANYEYETITVHFNGKYCLWSQRDLTVSGYDPPYTNYDNLFKAINHWNFDAASIISEVEQFIKARPIEPFTPEQNEEHFKKILNFINTNLGKNIVIAYYGVSSSFFTQKDYQLDDYIYPYAKGFYSTSYPPGGLTELVCPTKLEILYDYRRKDPQIIGQYIEKHEKIEYSLQSDDPVLHELTIKDSCQWADSLTLYFPTVKTSGSYIEDYYFYYPEYGDTKILDYANAFFELLGLFASVGGRNQKAINLKRQFGLIPNGSLYPSSVLYPQRVTGGKLYPEDYQSCWYDDAYTVQYGAIVCYFKTIETIEGQSKVTDATYTLYLNGFDEESDPNTYQIYEIKNNAIISDKVLTVVDGQYVYSDRTWTPQQIENICSAIAENLDGVSYMPVEFKGRGLPYVEAGDTFEILTKSNDSITTIVLNRTITGEQTLKDSYKSV